MVITLTFWPFSRVCDLLTLLFSFTPREYLKQIMCLMARHHPQNRFQAPLQEENQENLGKDQRQRWLESTQMEHHPDHNPAPHTVAKKNLGLDMG